MCCFGFILCMLLLRGRRGAREGARVGCKASDQTVGGACNTHKKSNQFKSKDTHAAPRVCDSSSTRERAPSHTRSKKWRQTGGGQKDRAKHKFLTNSPTHTPHAPPPPPRWCANRRATSTGLVTPEDGTPTARARATSATFVIPFNSASVAGAVDAPPPPAPGATPDPLAPGAARLEGGASRSGVVPARLAGAAAAAPPDDRAARAASSRCLR